MEAPPPPPGGTSSAGPWPPPSPPDPCLPWGTHQQATIFPAAGPQTWMILPRVQPMAPANPFGTTPMVMGLGSRFVFCHEPRTTQDKLLFPSESLLPSPASSDLQPELSKATGAFCSAKPQHMDPPLATTSGCPWLGRLRKSHLQGGTEQLEVMEIRLPCAGRAEKERKMKKSSFWGN